MARPDRNHAAAVVIYRLFFILDPNRKQIMLWEKKIQLKEEARSEFEKQNEEIQKLKMEIQNKEVTRLYFPPPPP